MNPADRFWRNFCFKSSVVRLAGMVLMMSLMTGTLHAEQKVYYRWTKPNYVKGLKPGARIDAWWRQTWKNHAIYFPKKGGEVLLSARSDKKGYRAPNTRRERLLERTRQRVAPAKPSRLNAVFAAADPARWKGLSRENGEAQQRTLIKIAPLKGQRASVHNAVHLEKLWYQLVAFPKLKSFGAKKQAVKRMRRLAELYWLAPSHEPGAHPEVLLPIGARFLGIAQ